MNKLNGMMGTLGGLKVVHNSLVPDDTIFVGDKLWKDLQDLPDSDEVKKLEECEHYVKHKACHFGVRRSCGISCDKVLKTK